MLCVTLVCVCDRVQAGLQCGGLRSGQQEGPAGGLPSVPAVPRAPPGGQRVLPLHHAQIREWEFSKNTHFSNKSPFYEEGNDIV